MNSPDAAKGRTRPAIDRLTAADLMFIWPETMGWPQDIGALAMLDGDKLFDAEGRFDIEAARTYVARRIHLVPRFRQIVCWPRLGLGWPLWVDAPSFDIAEHVGVFPVARPGGEAQLLDAWETLRRRPLEHSRPLWEMWFLTGLPDRRVGLFMKVHHSIADGVAGVATLSAFVDVAAGAPEPTEVSVAPQPAPSKREVFEDNVRCRLRDLQRIATALATPIETTRRIGRGWPALHEMFAEERGARTSVNRRIRADRTLAVIRSSLETAKNIGHAHGAKVNDVLLTALAAGYADLLRSRGERVDGVTLRAFVPVSLHTEKGAAASGNLDGGMAVPLPIGVRDDVQRLRLIAAETAERKKKSRPAGGSFFRNAALQRAFLRLMAKQRFMNGYVANVPGPPIPLYFAGARILELFPLVPISGNISIGVGALSYAGQLNVTVVADRDLCPDLDVFLGGVTRSLDALSCSLLAATP